MTVIRKILKTADEVSKYRKAKAAAQKYRCPICKGPLANAKYVALDHSHDNGHCRSVLCISCNIGEGKVKAAALFRTPKANLAYVDTVQWLRNLADYLEHHKNNPSGIIHPSFDLAKGKQKPLKRK